MRDTKKPRLPRRDGAVLMRLSYRAAKPALPLFAVARTVLHKTASLTRVIVADTINPCDTNLTQTRTH